MQIIVHRGTHQIGGCTTEIRTDSTRILIDFGSELPDAKSRILQDMLQIPGLNYGKENFDGVFLTHYHSDHIGLIPSIYESIPVYMGRVSVDICSAFSDRVKNGYKAADRICPLDALEPVTVGDMKITPIPADHSAYDAFMYLVESEGKRILHTGDFRLHGFRGKATPKLIRCYAQDIDVLIIEGTQISRENQSVVSELELQQEIKKEIKSHKYVFAMCASTNIDRLASFYNATPCGRYFVCDRYQKKILDLAAKESLSRWYRFDKALIYGKNLELEKRGFVMLVRANSQFEGIVSQYPDALFIYSMWEGYLGGRSSSLSEFVAPFEQSGHIRYLHSSGHATAYHTQMICNLVKPAIGIISIHTENGKGFGKLKLESPLLYLEDGEVFTF